MTRTAICSALILLAAGLCGCGPSSANVTPVPAPQNTDTWKQVDNPDYLNWKKYPPGTTVVRTSTSTSGGTSVTSVETFTLKAVTDDAATVTRQNTTTRSDGSYTKANESEERTVAARIRVHPDLKPADFQKPDLKAKEAGKEKVKCLDKEVECVRWEWSNGTEAGPMKVVSWLSDEVPGRIVKQEMTVAAIKSVTTETVTGWTKP